MAFTHVLVPTDFSASATHALRYAFEEAALHHATVTLLHVLPPHTGTEVYYITGAPREEVGLIPPWRAAWVYQAHRGPRSCSRITTRKP
jgi:universal stress protein A